MRLTLEQTVEQYELNVYRAAFFVCKNQQDAEDICQETFLAYYKSTQEFETPEHLRAWLLRTAVNKARDILRSFWHRKRENLDDYAEILTAASPEDGELLQAVLSLPEKCRVTVHLYYYEGYSVKEIAALLKISENTVKSQLYRGRSMLRDRLQEGWDNDES